MRQLRSLILFWRGELLSEAFQGSLDASDGQVHQSGRLLLGVPAAEDADDQGVDSVQSVEHIGPFCFGSHDFDRPGLLLSQGVPT